MKLVMATLIYLLSLVQPALAMVITVPAKNKQFQVHLAANPTTGYQWRISKYDNKLLKIMSKRFIPSKQQLVGAGGNTVFSIQLIKGVKVPKTTELQFNYARPWEQDNGSSEVVTVNFE